MPIPAAFDGDDERFTRELYEATAITVVPGSYLSRVAADGVNPGRGYIRIALVSEFDECLEAVTRLCNFLSSTVPMSVAAQPVAVAAQPVAVAAQPVVMAA